ncbi:WD40 repeat domain-containing protein kinase family protein [Nocardiopsis valliformis]|uniref:protein kinase n=1 Tax=Nocardiopsis valliformis TaxID=239974 RepID=UPI000345D571|nr:protein kinase [Nocardiopsis valliformis]
MRPLNPYDPPAAGPYRLLARLDEDTYTRAYLGAEPGRSPVRVRILRSGHATDSTTRADFLRRVESASGLGGPYVAAVVGSDLDSPVPWAATERPFGPDLAGLVRAHGPLPIAALHSLALATAQGLAALHSAQHAHGTLTPENILLASDRALLADPGLIPPVEVHDTARNVFDPPEGGGAPAGDVFAWAAVLCFAASGVEGPGGLERVPLQLRGVVDACLHENADLRPSAVDLVSMLGGAASAAPWPPELVSVIETSAAAMRSALPAESAAPAPGSRGRFLAFTAGALALTLISGIGAAWGLDLLASPGGNTADNGSAAEEEAGLTDGAACLDGSAFPEPSEPITDLDAMQVEFSPDGDLLAIGSFNHGLTLWDWRAGEEFARPVEELNGIGPLAFIPDSCMIAASSLQENEDQEHRYRLTTIYDLPSGETTDHLGVQPDPRPDGSQEYWSVMDLAFSPEGRLMASSNHTGAGSSTASVQVIDLDSGEPIATLGEGFIPELAFLDETRLALYTRSTIEIWDVESGEVLQTIRNITKLNFAVVPGQNQILFVRNDQLVLHDLDDNTVAATFSLDGYTDGPDEYVNHLGVDPELGLVHFSWSMSTGNPDPENPGTDRRNETYGHLWDLETGENLLADDDGFMPRPVAFHPEAIAAVNQDGNVDLIDPNTLEIIDVIQ